ncbi:MAG: hypothetical protein Q4F18_02430 [Clostridia bacterium]|nr:hypothetical protein [Clostridia bacterium]
MKSNSKHPLVNLLSLCGQIAEHKSEKTQEHGGDESRILAALNDDQQTQLKELLETLRQAWLKDHAEHHRKPQA